jgi:DNA topoisomerase-1
MNKYPIKRTIKGNSFRYLWKNGRTVSNNSTVDRIKKLRIPPAYINVKIYSSNAKIQATGYDDKKRKQYRYHPAWVEERGRKKFRGLIAFASAYPKIIRSINSQLNGSPKNKKEMIALAIGVLNICRIRPGSTKHLRDTGSFGTTTLLKGHIIEGKCPGSSSKCLLICFKGKSGVVNKCRITLNTKIGKSLYSLLKKKKKREDPVFYIDNSLVTPEDINKFLQNIGGRQVTAKAFRTYHANAQFISAMIPAIPYIKNISQTKRKKYTIEAIKKIAEELHHTPATFKNSYLFPPLRELFIENPEIFKKIFYKHNLDDALVSFIQKKTSKSSKTPKSWR